MAEPPKRPTRLPSVAMGCAQYANTPVLEGGSGRAFTIDEALLAMRWADLLRGRGYRLTISHCFPKADEVLEVHIPTASKPISRLHKGNRIIWSTDCLGHTHLFATLADALLALAPLSRRDRRIMLKARRPLWLDSLPVVGRAAEGPGPQSRVRWLDRMLRKLRAPSAPLPLPTPGPCR